MKKLVKKTTRYDLIAEAYNSGIISLKRLIGKVKAAEKKGLLIIKGSGLKNDSFYERNIKWYLGQLSRKGIISGYTSVLGRPIKAKKAVKRLTVKAKKTVTKAATKKITKKTKKILKKNVTKMKK